MVSAYVTRRRVVGGALGASAAILGAGCGAQGGSTPAPGPAGGTPTGRITWAIFPTFQ